MCIPTTKYMPSELEHSARQARPLRPSLRCTVTAIHTAEQIDAAAKALGDAARAIGEALAPMATAAGTAKPTEAEVDVVREAAATAVAMQPAVHVDLTPEVAEVEEEKD